MAFKTAYIEPVFFVRWIDPVPLDTHRVSDEFREARSRAGHPLVYIAIVPEECAVPDDATRAAMVSERDRVLPECSAMHIVMEGSGFKHAILRNAMAAMQLVAGSRDKKIVVGRTLDEALANASRTVPSEQRFSVATVLAKAMAAGVATPPAARAGNR